MSTATQDKAQLGELMAEGAFEAHRRGHRLGEFKTRAGGAMARCKKCGRHVQVETTRPTVFGSATYRGCEEVERGFHH